jgi:hypothetical protein
MKTEFTAKADKGKGEEAKKGRKNESIFSGFAVKIFTKTRYMGKNG